MNCHLVILKKPYLELILKGEKTIEMRLTKARHPGCGGVSAADRLFLKASGGPVWGVATVADVQRFEDLTPEGIAGIRRRYGRQIGGDDGTWDELMDRKSGVLVWLANVRRVAPVQIDKKDWRAWVRLTPEKDFGLLRQPQLLESHP